MISEEYRKLNAQLHQRKPSWGAQGGNHAAVVRQLVDEYDADSILDYGCGKGGLGKALGYEIAEYDPAIPGKDGTPAPADLVVCTDVLEHVEPQYLSAVLEDLKRVTRKVGYFVIALDAASNVLPNGMNAHQIQKDAEWWCAQVWVWFAVVRYRAGGNVARFVVEPK